MEYSIALDQNLATGEAIRNMTEAPLSLASIDWLQTYRIGYGSDLSLP
jgi:hypothetical protein